jgi:hypothetical protein
LEATDEKTLVPKLIFVGSGVSTMMLVSAVQPWKELLPMAIMPASRE